MKEVVVDALTIVASFSVAFIVFAQGLGIAPSRVLDLFVARPWLVLRVLLAVVVLVPAATLAILLGLRPAPGVAIGLAILVACPPAPLMVAQAPKKGASAEFMAGLHLGLSALAFLTVPAILQVLSRALGFTADVNLTTMGWTLARTILIPIGLGFLVRSVVPSVADRLTPTVDVIGKIGLVVVVLCLLPTFYSALLIMDPWSYLIIALVSVTALAIGHVAGPDDPHEKAGLAIECGVRHPALAIAIASANFSPAKALPVLVPCILTSALIAIIYLSIAPATRWRRAPPGDGSDAPAG